MSRKLQSVVGMLTGAGAVALLFCAGCGWSIGWEVCKSNPEHTAQPWCICGCNNNSQEPQCLDPNNACCYSAYGACKTTTTQTPSPSAGSAKSLPPSNKDSVRASISRCFNEDGVCTNAYPLLPCEAFYERITYVNFADVVQGASDRTRTPMLYISPAGLMPYAFSFPPKPVPWPSLSPGQPEEVAEEIQTPGSNGAQVAGLDPGAQQCKSSATFVIQLVGVPEVSLNSNGVMDSPMVEGSVSEPFGSCTAGSGC